MPHDLAVDLGYLRTYDAPTETVKGREPLPEWYGRWVQQPYLAQHDPRALPPAEVPISVRGDDRSLQRWCFTYPNLGVIDLLMLVRDVPLDGVPTSADLPALFNDSGWTAREGDASPKDTLQWLCDMTYADLTGTRVVTSEPRRTSFGVLVLLDKLPDMDTAIRGLRDGEALHAERYHHLVAGTRGKDLDALGPYVVLAGVIGRGRHLMKRVRYAIDETTTGVLEGKLSAEKGVEQSANIQAQAIRLHGEMSGWGYLNHDSMKRIFEDIDRSAGIPQRDRDNLHASLEGLDRLSNNLQGLAVDGFQRRVSIFGLFFGLFSVFLASVGIVTLVSDDTEWVERLWVIGTILALGLWFLGLGVWTKRRLRR